MTSIGQSINFTIYKSVIWFNPQVLCSFFVLLNRVTFSRPHINQRRYFIYFTQVFFFLVLPEHKEKRVSVVEHFILKRTN